MFLSCLAVRLRVGRVLFASVVFLLTLGSQARATTCESLAKLELPNTTITLARAETSGTFTPVDNVATGKQFTRLPPFCRVAATVSPTPDSVIKFEVWMPVSDWNHRFMAVGNGAWSGAIWYRPMAGALREGYATASTDTGHEGSPVDASFALGHPEKLIDFGYRAVHETTLKAKAIIAAFYGQGASHAYWDGCSSGGKQGLMEAQRFPDDYDGIISGAPANHWEHLSASAIWIGQATHASPGAFLTPEKLKILHEAVLDACDVSDGIKDGLISDPFTCHFDPRTLVCKSGDATSCLSAQQAAAARKIYSGPVNPRTGEQIFPGLEPGSELGWLAFAGPPEPPITTSHFKYVVFRDPNWDFRTFNFDSDMALADKIDNGTVAATNPNLSAFFSHGGKLLFYHGLNDPLIAPQNTIDYYKDVLHDTGAEGQASMRLYLAPGMNHCDGGDGPFDFDLYAPLADWVEHDKVPGFVIASHFPDGPRSHADRTRPLCPYPEVAKYKGTGSIDDAANFSCVKR
jgi:feruloyl esterase